jgi:hypothetical protein
MMKWVRSIAVVVAGFVVAAIVLMGVEMVGGRLYLPPGVDPTDEAAMRQVIPTLPVGAFVVLLIGDALSSLVGAGLAARLAGQSPLPHGLAVTALLLAGNAVNVVRIPHPAWVGVGSFVVFGAFGYLGARLAAGSAARAG